MSKVCLSREPWKRSVRTRSATSASLVVTAPPSPNAPRFFDGKKEKVAAVPSAPGRLGRVLHHRHAERLDLRDRDHVAEQVNDDDRLRARRHRGAHRLRRHAEGLRVDVAEHRPRTGGRDRLGGRVEGEGRHDDLVAGADADGLQGEGEGIRPVRHADRVLGPEI
jgi:hypothetical protein